MAVAPGRATGVYKWGIAGCGLISTDFTTCLLQNPRAKVIACASRSSEKARSFGERFGIPKVHSYDSLMRDSDIDIVYVGTVHTTHHQIVLDALNNGKHVLCEKPLAMNVDECAEMIDCARQNKRLLLEGVWTRFFPAVRETIRMVKEENAIGKVISYEGNFSVQMPDASIVPRLWDNSSGAGSTLETGLYTAHWLPLLFGADNMPIEMKTVGATSDIGRGKDQANNSQWGKTGSQDGKIDTFAATVLKYADNQYATLHTSMLATGDNIHRIVGEKGMIMLEGHAPDTLTLRMFDHERVNRVKHSGHKVCQFELPYYDGCSFIFTRSQGLSYEIDGVIKALDNGQLECDEYPWSHSLMANRILQKIRSSLGVSYSSSGARTASKL